MNVLLRRLGAWIRRLSRLFTVSFTGMAPMLTIGSLALFAFFVLPPTQFNNVGPLVQSHSAQINAVQREPGDVEEDSPETRHIPFEMRGMENRGKVEHVEDVQKVQLTQERVGMNILLRSGYLFEACKTVYPPAGRIARTEYRANLDPNIEACANPSNPGGEISDELQGSDEEGVSGDEENAGSASEDGSGSDEYLASGEIDLAREAQLLAIAAVAVEKFNRGPLQRRTEWLYSQGYASAFGHYPNLSLGPAQIRISTIQRAAKNWRASSVKFPSFQSEAAIADALANECKALGLAALLMLDSLKRIQQSCKVANVENCNLREVASAAYIGNRRKTNAVIDYAPVVSIMATMMDRDTCQSR